MLYLKLAMAATCRMEGAVSSLFINIYTFINVPLSAFSYMGSSNIS